MSRLNRKLRESINSYLAEVGAVTVPKGWHSTVSLARHLDLSSRSVTILLGRMIQAGDVEIRKFRVQSGQVLRPIPHYKFSPRAAKALGLDKPDKTS